MACCKTIESEIVEFRFLDTVHKNNIEYCALSQLYIWHKLSMTNIKITNLKLSLAQKNVFACYIILARINRENQKTNS